MSVHNRFGFVPEVARVRADELARHTADVIERVRAGEIIEITRNGKPIAMLSPPDGAPMAPPGVD